MMRKRNSCYSNFKSINCENLSNLKIEKPKSKIKWKNKPVFIIFSVLFFIIGIGAIFSKAKEGNFNFITKLTSQSSNLEKIEKSSAIQKIYTKDTENVSLNYDDASVKVKDEKLQCIEDDKILQWHKGLRKWECKKLARSVFGSLENKDVKINESGELECKEDGKVLYWDGKNDEWACGDASDMKFILLGNNGLSLSKSNLFVNAPTCSGNDKLQWTGNNFICSSDIDTDAQTLAFESNTNKLFIANGNNVDLSSIDTDKQTLSFDNGTNQLAISNGNNVDLTDFINDVHSSNWLLTGNSGTDENVNFLGTTDSKSLSFKTNNQEYLKLTSKGQLEFKNNGYSMFIGESAGNNDDLTDNHNVFIGYETGKENTTGDFNTIFGSNAFKNNTTGAENTFIGYSSGMSNTTGNSNTAVGNSSLINNTTGQENTAVGHINMMSNETGSRNSALGHFTFLREKDSQDSVVLGVGAGQGSGPQTGGIFVGGGSGGRVTTGNYNTFIGTWAGFSCITGANNIALGSGSSGGNGFVTKSRHIVLGNSVNSLSDTSDNQMTIGNLIYGTNIDGTLNNVSTGNIGIGTNTPTAREHIKGTTITNVVSALKISDSADKIILDLKNDKVVVTSGARIKAYTIKTGGYTIKNNDTEIIDGNTNGSSFTLTLPATPTDGIVFSLKNTGISGNNLTIARNGNNIDGVASDLTLTDNQSVELQYTANKWMKR